MNMRWVFRPGEGGVFSKATATGQAVEGTAGSGGRAPAATATLTSGLFRVPQEENLTFNLYTVNPNPVPIPVTLEINQGVGGDGAALKETIFSQEVTVPPHESFRLTPEVPAGAVVEVNARWTPAESLPGGGLPIIPTATVVQFFPADAGTLPHVTLAAGSFVVPALPGTAAPGRQALPLAPTGPITTGLIDIPQGVAAARPQIQLLLSSFAATPLTAAVVVRELVEHVPILEAISRQNVRVPAGGAAIVPLESVEGRTVKIDADLPPGLVASLTVFTLFLADNSTAPVFHLGPREWAVEG